MARINTDIMFRVYNNMNTYHDDIDTIFNWLYNIHYVNMVDNAESNGGLTNWVDLMRQYYGNTNPIVIKVDITDWKERTNHYDLLQNYVRNCIKETTKTIYTDYVPTISNDGNSYITITLLDENGEVVTSLPKNCDELGCQLTLASGDTVLQPFYLDANGCTSYFTSYNDGIRFDYGIIKTLDCVVKPAPISNKLHIRVVATPKYMVAVTGGTKYIVNQDNMGQYMTKKIWLENRYIKVPAGKTLQLKLLFNDDFNALNTKKLAKKYTSFAWFSSDKRVFTCEECDPITTRPTDINLFDDCITSTKPYLLVYKFPESGKFTMSLDSTFDNVPVEEGKDGGSLWYRIDNTFNYLTSADDFEHSKRLLKNNSKAFNGSIQLNVLKGQYLIIFTKTPTDPNVQDGIKCYDKYWSLSTNLIPNKITTDVKDQPLFDGMITKSDADLQPSYNMLINTQNKGKAKLTIVNPMDGNIVERYIEVI